MLKLAVKYPPAKACLQKNKTKQTKNPTQLPFPLFSLLSSQAQQLDPSRDQLGAGEPEVGACKFPLQGLRSL